MAAPRNRIGTYSLLAALVGFFFVSFQPWLPLTSLVVVPGLSLKRLLQAFFDASLVGSLADWFAVSALFRDPLGLRLPHTNILAKNKDAIAEAVPRFLTGFVTDERISEELARADFARRIGAALESGGLREEFHDFLRVRLSAWLSGFRGGEGPKRASLDGFVADLCSFVADTLDPAPAFAGFLRWARRESFDERVIAAAAELLRSEIGRNRVRLAAAITPIVKRNAGWRGLFIGRGTMEELLLGVEEELAEISADRSHQLRAFLVASLSRYADTLADAGPDVSGERETFAKGVRDALLDPGFRKGLADFTADILGRLGLDLGSDTGRFIEGLKRVEGGLARRLAADAELRARFNKELGKLASSLIIRGRLVDGLSTYVAGLLKATDPREFVGKVEDAVWNDLQYIRVNGAVVGGLVGLALSFLSAFFPA